MPGLDYQNGSPHWHCPPGLWWAGTLLLALYAGLKVLWPTLGEPGETTMALLGLMALLVWGGDLRRSMALWLLLAAVVVQCLSWTFMYLDHPDWAASNPQLDRLAKLFIFIAVAWWLGGSTQRTLLVWGLAVLGYVLATFLHGGGLEEWWRGLQGERAGFGIRNSQHGAMLYGVVLLGMVILHGRFWQPGAWRPWRIAAWVLLTFLALIGVLIGQTRAVWLALLVALPVAGMLAGWSRWSSAWGAGQSPSLPGWPWWWLAVFCLTGAVWLVAWLTPFHVAFTERAFQESGLLAQLLAGNFQDVPYTSIGIRINTWIAALEWIAQRPVLGWGSEARTLVIDHTPWLPPFVKEHFGHLHNFLLEIWVAYGLLGVLVMLWLAAWVGLATWRAWRGGVLPGDLALFGVAFFVYWVIMNQFESYNSFWTGVYVHNLMVGGLVTHYWRWQREAA